MPKQLAIPGLRDAMKKNVTRREQFLAEMDAVVPWGRLLGLIAPALPDGRTKGRTAAGDGAAGLFPAELVSLFIQPNDAPLRLFRGRRHLWQRPRQRRHKMPLRVHQPV